MADPTSLGVIDEFVVTFTSYIDSGFGLLGGEVQYLTAILIGIDITLAGLYWAMGSDNSCLLYTSPSPRDRTRSRMPSSA